MQTALCKIQKKLPKYAWSLYESSMKLYKYCNICTHRQGLYHLIKELFYAWGSNLHNQTHQLISTKNVLDKRIHVISKGGIIKQRLYFSVCFSSVRCLIFCEMQFQKLWFWIDGCYKIVLNRAVLMNFRKKLILKQHFLNITGSNLQNVIPKFPSKLVNWFS